MTVEETGSTTAARSGLRSPGVRAWMRLVHVFQKVERAGAEQTRCHGLSMAQFDVLAHVGAREGLTQQELADSRLVTKGNICQLLDRMEASGLLCRRQQGRANRLYLTERGRGLYARVVPLHESMIAGAFAALTPAEQTTLLELLRKLDRSLSH